MRVLESPTWYFPSDNLTMENCTGHVQWLTRLCTCNQWTEDSALPSAWAPKSPTRLWVKLNGVFPASRAIPELAAEVRAGG